MFISSEAFVESHGGRIGDLSIYGQESNPTTWRLARMNLAIRGIDANLGDTHADSFTRDLHKDLKAEFILANPPFNMNDWGGERLENDSRWKFGTPALRNANFAWVQHIIHHLAPDGLAGFVLSNGALSSNQTGEGDIRNEIIAKDLVDCIIYLPPQLFYTTQISVSLWLVARNKRKKGERVRAGETLFIYAYDMGHLVDRTHRELDENEIGKIVETYHKWQGRSKEKYSDEEGFSYSASIDEIKLHKGALVPGRYVGFSKDLFESFDSSVLKGEVEEMRKRVDEITGKSLAALLSLESMKNG